MRPINGKPEQPLKPEAALLEQARRLDKGALAEIYDAYSPGLYRYAVGLLGSPDLAEECVAETFSRFLQALHRGAGPNRNLQAYLYRVAHNWITDQYRREPPVEDMDIEMNAAQEASPSELFAQEVERELMRVALRRLTPDQRQVIVLKYLHGWENDQIAAALDKPVGAVRSLQHRGLEALRRIWIAEELNV